MELDNAQMVAVAPHQNSILLLNVLSGHHSEEMCFPLMAAMALFDQFANMKMIAQVDCCDTEDPGMVVAR
jgi:hypothetical protein